MPPVGERTCDVLVVGGGPSGLFLAALLAQRGVDVVVLERRREPSGHSRAIGLHPPALAALHTLGLEGPAVADGVRIRRGVARSRGRELGGLTFEQAWPDRPFVLSLPQHRTEALLRDRLEELAPGALRRGREVVGTEEDGEDVLVTERPAGTGVTGDTWRARVLVGADGPQSLVREHAGIGTRERAYHHAYLMGDYADTTDDPGTAVIHLEDGGVVESFPLPGGVRRWVAHTGPTPAEASAGLLAEIVRRRTGHAVEVATCTMTSAFSVRRRIADRMVAGRRVLLGDAAHEISPIGGQGMTLGWLDAVALAPLLEELACDGEGASDLPAELREVERARLRAARRAARRAELNMTAGRPLRPVVGRVRDGLVRVAVGSPVRPRLARAFTMHAV